MPVAPPPVVISQRTGIRIERSLPTALGHGLYSVVQRLVSEGVLQRTVVTGGYWLFALVPDELGLTEARCGERWLHLPRRRAFVIPPRSLLSLCLSQVRHISYGVIGRVPLPEPIAEMPRVVQLPPDEALAPRTLAQITELLASGVTLDPDRDAPELARAARPLLHQFIAQPSPVRMVAATLGVSPDTISRVFRTTYGLSPKQYLQRARVSDALLALVAGTGVVRAGLEASFNDVSRLYRVFRRSTGNTPGEYAALHDRKPPRR